MKKYRFTVWIIIICIILCQLQPKVVYGDEQQSRKIRVGYYTAEGFQDYDKDTESYSGYSYEYLLAIAQYTGWQYEFVPVTFSEGLEMVKSGELDLMNNVSRTKEREDYYEFSNLSSGSNCAYLAMKADDRRVGFEDFEKFNDIKVGLMLGSHYNDLFIEYCEENNCMPKIIYYDIREDVEEAMDNGDIDAEVITSTLGGNIHTIGRFAPEYYYFATTKGNTQLIKQLNMAMNSIKTNDPAFESKLFDKYYNSLEENYMVMTNEEEEYIRENPVINVVYHGDASPISYIDESGNFAGAIADMYSLISKRTGLKFSFIEFNDINKDMANSPGPQYVLADTPYDFIWADKNNTNLTQSFLTVSIIRAASQNARDNGIMAVKRNDFIGEFCKERYKDKYEYKEYDTTKQCIDAVKNGSADYTCMTSYEYEYYQAQAQYRFLNFEVMPGVDYSFSIGVSKSADPCLFSIMTKALDTISEDEVRDIMRFTSINRRKASIVDIIYENPKVTIRVLLVMGFCIGAIIFLLIYYRMLRVKNRQLAIAAAEAEKANRSKTDFLSQMSHDIRTPMNAIIGMTGLAKDERDPLKKDEYLDKINSSGHFLLGLVNDILDMNKVESGKLTLYPEVYTYQEFMDYVQSVFEPLCNEKHINFNVVDNIKAVNAFYVDKLRFNQILFNLLSNAIKYTEEEGHVELILDSNGICGKDMALRIVVKDDGMGMGGDFRKHLFEPFQQENHESALTGSGLGLAIVKRLVDLMGGTIKVTSAPGEGTEFQIFLLLKEADIEDKATDKMALIENIDLKGKHALICEDNNINIEIISKFLKKKKMEVTVARDGSEAVTIFENSDPNTFDVILMDIRMPVMNGLVATKTIRGLNRSDSKTVPIIAMTADAFDENRQETMEAGMDEHLSKPIDIRKLYATLDYYCHRV